MDPSILPTLGFICGTGLGAALTWRMMEPLLHSAMASAAEKQAQLDQIHANHVRAGKTSHAAYRANVLETADRIRAGLNPSNSPESVLTGVNGQTAAGFVSPPFIPLPPLTPSTADATSAKPVQPRVSSAGADQGKHHAGANDRDVAINHERN